MKRNQKGFTLMEMLIVVAIIAVLVAVAIPVYTSQMHKVRVAADKANVRAYYAEIQADYMLTEEQNPKVSVLEHDGSNVGSYPWNKITFLDGTEVTLQNGKCAIYFVKDKGYSMFYQCNGNHLNCELSLG